MLENSRCERAQNSTGCFEKISVFLRKDNSSNQFAVTIFDKWIVSNSTLACAQPRTAFSPTSAFIARGLAHVRLE
jgi:hypothetical protein